MSRFRRNVSFCSSTTHLQNGWSLLKVSSSRCIVSLLLLNGLLSNHLFCYTRCYEFEGYYAEAYYEFAGPIFPSFCLRATQSGLTGPRFEPQTSRSTDGCVTAKPTARLVNGWVKSRFETDACILSRYGKYAKTVSRCFYASKLLLVSDFLLWMVQLKLYCITPDFIYLSASLLKYHTLVILKRQRPWKWCHLSYSLKKIFSVAWASINQKLYR